MSRHRARWAVLAAALVLSGCSALGGAGGDATPTPDTRPPDASGGTAPSASATPEADVPTSWGPTEAEVAEAAAMVADWTPEQLAGQVIVGRFHGYDAEAAERLVAEHHLAGLSVTNGNVADTEQVRALTAAISAGVAADGRAFPAVVGVDQEGGYVSHLRGVATEFPAFTAVGEAIERDLRGGRDVSREAARATGLELRELGFTWVFAPVADVTIGAADPTIGSRSASSDPAVAAKAVATAVRGFNDAGVVSTTKHFPGHGAATSDSHDTLPVLDVPLAELRERELVPFEAALRAKAPSVMMSHLDVAAVDEGLPASLAPGVYDLLRDEIGFDGVAITDSLGMGALGGIERPAVRALQAGADLLLMPVDTATTHEIVTEAIASGEVPRERAEEAAARVVALQLWQQRRAQRVGVPPDAAELAALASQALTDAAYG